MSAFFLEHPRETDLALFAGGESGPFARWRIERHVERCPQCQEITADFFRLPVQLNELADLPVVDWRRMAMGSKKVRQYWLYSSRKERYSSASAAETWSRGVSMIGPPRVRRSARTSAPARSARSWTRWRRSR